MAITQDVNFAMSLCFQNSPAAVPLGTMLPVQRAFVPLAAGVDRGKERDGTPKSVEFQLFVPFKI